MNKGNKNKNYMGVHRRTWYGDDAQILYYYFKNKHGAIRYWDTWLGEGDSSETEIINTNDCDESFIVNFNDEQYIVMFSNCDDVFAATCDIYIIDEEETSSMKQEQKEPELFVLTVLDNECEGQFIKELTVLGKDNLDKAITAMHAAYIGCIVVVNKGVICFDGYVAKGDYIGDF